MRRKKKNIYNISFLKYMPINGDTQCLTQADLRYNTTMFCQSASRFFLFLLLCSRARVTWVHFYGPHYYGEGGMTNRGKQQISSSKDGIHFWGKGKRKKKLRIIPDEKKSSPTNYEQINSVNNGSTWNLDQTIYHHSETIPLLYMHAHVLAHMRTLTGRERQNHQLCASPAGPGRACNSGWRALTTMLMFGRKSASYCTHKAATAAICNSDRRRVKKIRCFAATKGLDATDLLRPNQPQF